MTHSPIRVLLIEDDETLAAGVSYLLRLEGADVDVLHDGRHAVGMVAHMRPDVVVLDIGLRGVDGIVVGGALRGAWPELPIIFATGNARSPRLRDIASDPRTIVLEKPYAIESLLATIYTMMARN